MTRRTLKLMAIGYVIKTIAFGAAWWMIPDLPERAMDTARQAWVWAAGSQVPPLPVGVPASRPVTAP